MEYNSVKRLGLDHYDIDINKSYELYDQDTNNHIIVLFLNKENNVKCPYCNQYNHIKSKGTKFNTFKYSVPSEKNITIKLYKHSYVCTECKKYFLQRNPFVLESNSISLNTDIEILEALRDKTQTYSSVANKFKVSATYVVNLFDKKVDIKTLPLPEVLAIDEVYSKKLSKTKYCFILYAPHWHKIIDVLDCRKKLFLVDYFSRVPQSQKDKVIYVSMDMYETYRQTIRLCLPMAVICVDSFHVVKAINKNFNLVRIRIMKKHEKFKYEKSSYYWLLKKYWKFLLMDISNIKDGYFKVSKSGMTMDKHQIIHTMINVDSELKLAYELKEAYREFNLTSDTTNAEERLLELIFKFQKSKIPEYVETWKMLVNWQTEIINSFNIYNGKRISNGSMERVNRNIKTLFGISFGSSNFTRMRNRILFTNNENAPILGSRKEKTNKRVGKPRRPYKTEK